MGHVIYKPQHGSLEWLRLRHRTEDGHAVVAASEAAAVHGEHRFKTRHELFAEKIAAEPTVTETNEAMDRGNRLEPTIRQWAADKLDTRLVEPSFMYMVDSSQYAMVATLDAVDEYSYEQNAATPRLVVEIKTYNRQWDGVLPRYWYWQGVQQAICANVDSITWAIFDSTLTLNLFVQNVSHDEKMAHIQAVQEFLWWVQVGEPNPEWPVSYNDVAEMYPTATAKTVDLTAHAHVFSELADVQFQIKELQTIETELKGKIGSLLGNAETGIVNGATIVTWKNQSRSSFDSKGFSKDHPGLAEKYTKSGTYRVLRTKGER
jgi:predicted phage-related endonuclease